MPFESRRLDVTAQAGDHAPDGLTVAAWSTQPRRLGQTRPASAPEGRRAPTPRRSTGPRQPRRSHRENATPDPPRSPRVRHERELPPGGPTTRTSCVTAPPVNLGGRVREGRPDHCCHSWAPARSPRISTSCARKGSDPRLTVGVRLLPTSQLSMFLDAQAVSPASTIRPQRRHCRVVSPSTRRRAHLWPASTQRMFVIGNSMTLRSLLLDDDPRMHLRRDRRPPSPRRFLLLKPSSAGPSGAPHRRLSGLVDRAPRGGDRGRVRAGDVQLPVATECWT